MNGVQVYSGGTTHKIQRSRVENWQTALRENGGKLSKAGSFADMPVHHAFRTVIWTDELTKQTLVILVECAISPTEAKKSSLFNSVL